MKVGCPQVHSFMLLFFYDCRHQAREAEPKDYDINRSDTRNLCNASYKRIGDFTDGVSLFIHVALHYAISYD